MRTQTTFPVKRPRKFPVKIGRGNAMVTMYLREYERNGETYEEFRLPFDRGDGRQFVLFSHYDKARTWANEELFRLSRVASGDITLKADAATDYRQALELAKPFGLTLAGVALRFAESMKELNGVPVPLVVAARECANRHRTPLLDKTVPQVVDEFIKAKEDAKRSKRYTEDLTYRLGKFKATFQTSIGRIDAFQLRDFMDGLKNESGGKLSPRSYNNFRTALISLFEFAKTKTRRYLPADWNEFDGIGSMKDSGGAIGIFTPDELAALLTHAGEDLIPFLSIGAFAGLRSAEIDRLDWQDVKFSTGYIVVEAGKAKTAARRVVPMSANLKEWLQPYAKTRGKVWPHTHAYLYEVLSATAGKAGVEWKPNALRHSYISYRVADTSDVNKIALEAGNSPAMIFSNYRELVLPEDAKRWFSIKPGGEGQEKVVWLKVA